MRTAHPTRWARAAVVALAVGLLAGGALSAGSAFARVWTDKPDYAPGETVTISGDNSDGAGYLPGETVVVDVVGPNGFAASCEAVADDDGAWSCQVALWGDDRAIGQYSYTATGLHSGVTESGVFTDARNWVLKFAGTGSGSVTITVSSGTVSAPTSCGGTGAPASSQTVTSTCSPNITTSDNNATVTFSASAAAGSVFAGWSNPQGLSGSTCTGTTNPCSAVIGSNAELTVTFNAAATATPTPTNTFTATPTPTDTATPTPTSTPTPTNVPPTADAGGPYSGSEGSPIPLDGSGSSDPDGVIVSYEWDLDNDGQYDDASGVNVTVTFPDNGTYTVGLKVTDDDGATDTDSATVEVANVAPTVTLTGPASADEGDTKSYSYSVSDPGADTFPTHTVSCGGGTLSNQSTDTTAGSGSFDCTFPDDGTYVVSVTVEDDDGGSGSDSVSVAVANVAPTITDVTNDGPVNEGSSATVTVSATDPAGAFDPLAYEFDCDNNGTYEVGPQPGDASSCFFADDGVYTVVVRVSDGDGGVATGSTWVAVNNVAPTVNAGPDFTVMWTNGGASVSLPAANFIDPGTDTHTCSIDWDDSSVDAGALTETVGTPTTGTCSGGPHVYSAPGAYTIAVTVCDDEGLCGVDQVVVTIQVAFYGFLQPLNDPAVSTNTPSVWKKGSNIPIKFQLRDANGMPIPDALAEAIVAQCPSGGGARIAVAKVNGGLIFATEAETSSSPTADGGVCFRYDASADQFIYNVGTKTAFYSTSYQYRAMANVWFNGALIATHEQANTFGLK
ncbi:MAG TPA: PKD domain-containing protein [Dehalococcoidia bacterium]|nr:PKD domain-containing protein [Dehalococcoidia bacterium]